MNKFPVLGNQAMRTLNPVPENHVCFSVESPETTIASPPKQKDFCLYVCVHLCCMD